MVGALISGSSLLVSTEITFERLRDRQIKAAYIGNGLDDILAAYQTKPPMGRFGLIAVAAAELALNEAGIDPNNKCGERWGVAVCSQSGPISSARSYLEEVLASPDGRSSPIAFPKTTANIALGDVARRFGLRGPSCMIFGDSAVEFGVDQVSSGRADLMVCIYVELERLPKPDLAGEGSGDRAAAVIVESVLGSNLYERENILLAAHDRGEVADRVSQTLLEPYDDLEILRRIFECDVNGLFRSIAEFRLSVLLLELRHQLYMYDRNVDRLRCWARYAVGSSLSVEACTL